MCILPRPAPEVVRFERDRVGLSVTGAGFKGFGMSFSFRALSVGVMAGVFLLAAASPSPASSLRGSEYSVQKQYQVARSLKLSPVRSSKELLALVDKGVLVTVPGGENYELDGVSFPYARPSTKLFIDQLAKEYSSFTGERLVITSLTRPLSRQPRNASTLSVHPMGIAADIRRPTTPKARSWLEQKLRTLETQGVIEATHERRPPHYHVAVFPNHVESYAGKIPPSPDLALTSSPAPSTIQGTPALPAASKTLSTTPQPYNAYRVRRGDTLWTIASRFKTSVVRLRNLNGLHTSRIYPGQKLMVPEGSWE